MSKDMRDLQSLAELVNGDGEEVRFAGVRGKKERQGRVPVE